MVRRKVENCMICASAMYTAEMEMVKTKRKETLYICKKCWNEIPKKGDKHDSAH